MLIVVKFSTKTVFLHRSVNTVSTKNPEGSSWGVRLVTVSHHGVVGLGPRAFGVEGKRLAAGSQGC